MLRAPPGICSGYCTLTVASLKMEHTDLQVSLSLSMTYLYFSSKSREPRALLSNVTTEANKTFCIKSFKSHWGGWSNIQLPQFFYCKQLRNSRKHDFSYFIFHIYDNTNTYSTAAYSAVSSLLLYQAVNNKEFLSLCNKPDIERCLSV